MDKALSREGYIQTICVLGKKIRTTQKYWQHIIDHKHGELAGRLDEALATLNKADAVYQHPASQDLYLYYCQINKHWVCVVARHLNSEGFIVTAYLTSKAKRKGKLIWQKTMDK